MQARLRALRQHNRAHIAERLQQGLPVSNTATDDAFRALGLVAAISRFTDKLLLMGKAVHSNAWLRKRAPRRWPVRNLSYL